MGPVVKFHKGIVVAGEIDRVKAGRLKRAMDLYENVRDQAGVPEWVKPWATYWIGEAGLTLGTPDALSRAVTELEKVVNDHSDHFVIARATYALAEALRQSDRGTDAEAQYEKLETGPWGDRWRHLAKYGKGMSLLARGENNLARTMFAQIRDQSIDPVLISRATFGEGAALINEKRYDDAIAHFARLKEEAASGGADAAPVIAAALVGLAESYLKADPANEQNKKRALIAYIEVTVLYSGAGENYAKALHGAAKIYRDLGQTARAEELERELKERCPDSEYARGLGGSEGGSEGGGN